MEKRASLFAVLFIFLLVAHRVAAIPTSGQHTQPFWNLTRAQLDSTIGFEAIEGRQLIDIEVRWDGTVERFAAVFAKVEGTVHHEIQVDGARWSDFLEEMKALSGRWLDVEVNDFGISVAPRKRRCGIFIEGGEDYDYQIRTTNDDVDFQDLLKENQVLGRQIIDFEAYRDAAIGLTRYAGVWVNGEGQPRTSLYYNLQDAEVTSLLSPAKGRVVDIERYPSTPHGGDIRYAIIIAPYGADDPTMLRDEPIGSLADGASFDGDPRHLIDLETWDDGTGLRYTGVWGDLPKSLREVAPYPNNDRLVAVPPAALNVINNPPVVTLGDSAVIGLHAKNLRTGQTMGARSDEAFYLASTAKIAIHIRLWQLVEQGVLDMNTAIQFTTGLTSPDPYFVDDRLNPRSTLDPTPVTYTGLSSCGCNGTGVTGPNCGCNTPPPGFPIVCTGQVDLGQSIPLQRLDAVMMLMSDNASTSMLVDAPGTGLAFKNSFDDLDLNEWLSQIPGVGRGMGPLTSIQELDRVIVWQGQEAWLRQQVGVTSYQSLLLAPGGSLETTFRFDEQTICQGNQWGPSTGGPPISTLYGWLGTTDVPDFDLVGPNMDGAISGFERYYSMGLNSAEPRAMTNLIERFVENEFTSSANTRLALNVMGEGSPPLRMGRFANRPVLPSHFRVSTKGGSKGGVNQSPRAEVGIYTMMDPNGNVRSPDTIVIGIYGKNNTYASFGCIPGGNCACPRPLNRSCTVNNPAPQPPLNWTSPFRLIAEAVLPALTANLVDAGSRTRDFSPDAALPGEQITVLAEILNEGGGDAPAYDVVFYASTDLEISVADVELGRFRVINHLGGTTVPIEIELELPSSLAPGNYNIGWIIDPMTDAGGGIQTMGEVGEFYEFAADIPTSQPAFFPIRPVSDHYNPVVTRKQLTVPALSQLGFASTTATARENDGSVDFLVFRSGGSVGPISVDYLATGGTAGSGDYLPAAGTLHWADGDLFPKLFTLHLVVDGPGEPPETILLTLSNPTGFAALGSQSQLVLTVTDGLVQPFDAGDAPFPYPTLMIDLGARHAIDEFALRSPRLGTLRDEDSDGRPDTDALGDDLEGDDDEDGIVFSTPIFGGFAPSIEITASEDGLVDAWIDFNADGDWRDAGERIFDGLAVSAGLNRESFSVPPDASVGPTFARFRISSTGVRDETGLAGDGEVEDYRVEIVDPLPRLSIAGARVEEGDEGTKTIPFVISLSDATTQPVEVTATTAHGSANGSDYLSASERVSFSPGGPLTQIFEVTIYGDRDFESDETLRVELSNPTASVIEDGIATGVIENDDSADNDGDGAADAVEDQAPNGGDGNADGTPDSEQGHVASIRTADKSGMITIAAPSECLIVQASATARATFPEDELPSSFDMVGFELECAEADVQVLYHGAPTPTGKLSGLVYRKFGGQPGDPLPHWYSHPASFDYRATRGTRISPPETVLVAEFHLSDGRSGDHDLRRNGRIVDPGHPAVATDLGEPCTQPTQCSTGNCVDGVCCDLACTAAGASCNQPASRGQCVVPAPAPALSPAAVLMAVLVLVTIARRRYSAVPRSEH